MRRDLFRRFIVYLLIVIVVFLGAGRGASANQLKQSDGDKVIAESGFKPTENGFPFQNYGNDINPVNLTSVELRRLFGDAVCAATPAEDGSCILTPPADEWMQTLNKGMGGGHCDGMATLSSLLYYKSKPDVETRVGDKPAFQIPFENNETLQREIAYWFTTQATSPGNTQDIKGAPSKIVQTLIDAMTNKTETYTIGIFQPDRSGGHSITPYEVRDKGNGINWIMIYDNNFPGEERHIEVDMNAETWTYFTAANPNEPGAEYKGNAETETLTLTPDSARLAPQQCPVCVTAQSKAGLALQTTQYDEVWLVGDNQPDSKMNLLITDEQGRRLGYVDGKLVSEIPGARYIFLRSNFLSDEQEPVYYVPVGIKTSIVLDASKSTREENAEISIIGPTRDFAIDNVKVGPGDIDKIDFAADGIGITYTPSSGESPDISLGISTPGADYEFTVYGFDLDVGAGVNIALDQTAGKLSISTSGAKSAATYGLYVNRIDDNREDEFYAEDIVLDAGASAYVNYGKWDGKGDLTLEFSSKGDGTIDKTVAEKNTPKPPKK